MGHIFRAFVMLACLAVVPVVAMYGKQIQEFGRAVLETYRARVQTKSEVAPAVATGTATLQTGSPAPAADPMLSASPWSENSAARQPGTLPALVAVSGAKQSPLDDHRLPDALVANTSGGVQQASFSDSPTSEKQRGGAKLVGESPNSPSATTLSTAQFRRIEQRLRQLGATYYLLETWGPAGDRYRFFCRMAIAGNSDYGRNRIFQSTDSDPLRAMQSVLDQAEQWRNGRQQ
jgi:hypothetical protein